MKKQGFSLIEMVVIISVMAVVIVAIVSMLLNSFKARNRVDMTDTLEQNGSYVLGEITKNFLNSEGKSAVCGGNSLTLVNLKDGQTTVILCTEGADIASNSAVLSKGVTVSNCNTFVSCDKDTDGNVTAVNISFTLSAGAAGSGVENTGYRVFQTKVAARN